MSLLRVDASLRAEGSHSRELADIVEQEWLAGRPGTAVVRRDVGLDPLPATALGSALAAREVADEQRSPEQRAALELAQTLATELLAADALLVSIPFYNFGVSQH